MSFLQVTILDCLWGRYVREFGEWCEGRDAIPARHASTRTTQLYNKLPEEISLDEIERIHI